jgi:hypothetical protein
LGQQKKEASDGDSPYLINSLLIQFHLKLFNPVSEPYHPVFGKPIKTREYAQEFHKFLHQTILRIHVVYLE